MKDFVDKEKNIIKESFESISGNEEMLSKIIEFFPYPIHVYSPDGTMILTNEACLKVMHIPSNVVHAAVAVEDTLDMDVFCPPRQDWLDKTDDYLRGK